MANLDLNRKRRKAIWSLSGAACATLWGLVELTALWRARLKRH